MSSILCVFAHPDDESWLVGGSLILAAEQGHSVHLVCATSGESAKCFDHSISTKECLGETRREELKKAARVIGAFEPIFMNYVDGTLADLDAAEPVCRLIEITNMIKPDVLITFDQTGMTYHQDHQTIHKWCFKMFQDKRLKTIPGKIFLATADLGQGWMCVRHGSPVGVPLSEIALCIDIRRVKEQKVQAIKSHRVMCSTFYEKKMMSASDELNVWFPYEYFIRVDQDSEKLNVKEDFFV